MRNAPKTRAVDIAQWISARGGIVHRQLARDAQWTDAAIRRAVSTGGVAVIRRAWLATDAASIDLVAAAKAGGRIACVSIARERGWWMPAGTDSRGHLSIPPRGRAGSISPDDVVHWSIPIVPASRFSLRESVEDALAHVATCLAAESARVVWESAMKKERIAVEAIRAVQWPTRAAARVAAVVSDLSDSGLETIFLVRLSPWGIPIRQQVVLAGRPVDFLLAERLVVQVDGYAYHSSAADRGRDVAHDAELRLRGFTVLRFTYGQVHNDWPGVERTIARAVAAGLHLARSYR